MSFKKIALYTCLGAAIGFAISYSNKNSKTFVINDYERYDIASATMSGAIIGCTSECCPILCFIYVMFLIFKN
jgi:hypothetical protein